jgi:hypothetical protein
MNQFLQVNTYLFLFQLWVSRDNMVYVVTGLQAEYLRRLGFIQSLERNLTLRKCPDWLWGPPLVFCSVDTRGSFLSYNLASV